MMPTMLKRNAPMKIDSTVCETESARSNCVVRGVAVEAAEAKAETMMPSEKVVTASMELARM